MGSYGFKPQEAVDWLGAKFAPVVPHLGRQASTREACTWLDSARTTTLMADLDRSDPSEWKREGFTPPTGWPGGRPAAFEDALLLARSGMRPPPPGTATKLKGCGPGCRHGRGPGGHRRPHPEAVWGRSSPHVKAAGLAALAFCAVLAAISCAGAHKCAASARPTGTKARRPPSTPGSPGSPAARSSFIPCQCRPRACPRARRPAAPPRFPIRAAQKRSGPPGAMRPDPQRPPPLHPLQRAPMCARSRIQPHKFPGSTSPNTSAAGTAENTSPSSATRPSCWWRAASS